MTQIYTPNEIATGLKVSKLAVYKWLQKGELKGFKAGKMWRVTREDLEAFIGRSITLEIKPKDTKETSKDTKETPKE